MKRKQDKLSERATAQHAPPGEGRDLALISSCCADLMRTVGTDPEVAKKWVQAVVSIGERIPTPGRRDDLLVESLSVLAEMLRREGHRETARDILTEAGKWLPTSRSPRLHVHYWHRRGLLCRDLGQWDEALTAFGQAAALAQAQGWVEAEGKALFEKAEVELTIGDGLAAISSFAAVISLEERGLSPRVSLLALQSLALALALTGRDREAIEMLDAARGSHAAVRETPEYLQLLLIEGQLLRESERDKAERLLAGACSGFFRLGSEQEAARACLAVAVLLTKAGRLQELHGLCSEMAPLMGSEKLPRATRDALATFREAVEAGCLTPQFAEEIGAFLYQVKLEP